MTDHEEVWVIAHDEESERRFMAAMPRDSRVRRQRTGVRTPSEPGIMIAAELARYGLQRGEVDGELAFELMECIGDGAVRLICVAPATGSAALYDFCHGREIVLLSPDHADFVERVRATFRV